ncbi:chromate transporter [Paenibacillus sp. WLX2291]|uniref:chromate transporter n=1 Tax=Paenibacillus sp. WLX2291 TaxID=3296934 RepID=UPI003983FE5D
MLVWQLFLSFLKIGFVSFGGGYAVIPLIQHDAEQFGWMSADTFRQTVSIAGMAPGSIATNSATLIGYDVAGIAGAFAATTGIVLPSLVLVITLTGLFYRLGSSRMVKSSFYGLRPIVTGLIVYAAIHFGLGSGWDALLQWKTWLTLLIGAGVFLAIIKYKAHPLLVILGSAIMGIVLF